MGKAGRVGSFDSMFTVGTRHDENLALHQYIDDAVSLQKCSQCHIGIIISKDLPSSVSLAFIKSQIICQPESVKFSPCSLFPAINQLLII